MRLLGLEIHALPGVEPGFSLDDVAEGITLVTGPNASGKSSLVRALGFLLSEPRASDPAGLSLSASFESEAGLLRARRLGREVTWELDGRPAARPDLPESDQLRGYLVSMEDLLAAESYDARLVEELRRAMGGGYDLEALRREPPLERGARAGRAEAKILREAERKLREVEAGYEALRREEAALPAMEGELDAAIEAGERVARIEAATELADIRAERLGIQAGLAGMPPGMELLRGDELSRLEKIQEKTAEVRRERLAASRAREAALRRLEETGLAGGRPKQALLRLCSSELEHARRKRDELDRERRRHETALSAEGRAIESLGGGSAAPALDPHGVKRAEELAVELHAANLRRAELARVLQEWEEKEADGGPVPARSPAGDEGADSSRADDLRRAVDALRQWLAASQGASRRQGAAVILAGAFALLAALAAFFSGAVAALVAAVLAFLASVVATLESRSGGRAEARRRFEECGDAAPSSWERGPVEECLRELESMRASLLRRAADAEQAEETRRALGRVEEDLGGLEKERERLAEELGFDPSLTAAAMDRFVRLSVDYERAHRERLAASRAMSRLGSEISAAKEGVDAVLTRWCGGEGQGASGESAKAGERVEGPGRAGFVEGVAAIGEAGAGGVRRDAAFSADPGEAGAGEVERDGAFSADPGAAGAGGVERDASFSANDREGAEGALELLETEARLAELLARAERAEAAEGELREAERDSARLAVRESELEEEEAASFASAGIEAGGHLELRDRLGRLDAFREASERLRAAEVLEAEKRRALEGDEALLEAVDRGDRRSLEVELRSAAEEASRAGELRERLADLRSRLRAAGGDGRLESALFDRNAARDALEDERDAALLSRAGLFLLDEVKAEHRREHEPKIVRDARAWFRRFTHDAFDLEIDEAGIFMARDLSSRATRTLDELSSATRMQLLLSTRLAWTRSEERGRESLPLVLDEALTTSDEHRFAEGASCLETLAREEGRQVLYLAARRHEVALWERATGREPHHVDLADLRFGPGAASPFHLEPPPLKRVPAPDGHTPESYAAALGVPPCDPRGPAGAMHVFHVLRDDLSLLHRLMDDWRMRTLGQLEAFLESSAAEVAVGDRGQRGLLLARCAAARAWGAAWRRGRGRPVDRVALERSGAVSETFLARLSELASALEGDGEALIHALRSKEVARFRESSVDELEQWLEAEGYIDRESSLGPDERCGEVLAESARLAGEVREIREVVDWLEAALPREAS